jgi:2-polyprenyl-6-hydroxyphenyl methylase/3-demethylubiquinone-9 3-methyltransferase
VLWLAGITAALFAALTVAILTHLDVVQGGDDRIHGWVVASRSAWSVSLMRVVTWGGSTAFALPALAVVGAISLRRGRSPGDRLAAGLLLVGIGSVGVYLGLVINAWVGRPRPPIQDWAASAGGPAFPSGHSTTACVFAVLSAWALTARVDSRRGRALLWAVAVVFASSVGWSRVWLGVHWPSDVTGGLLFGVAWSATILGVLSWQRSRRPRAQPGSDAYGGEAPRRPGLRGGPVAEHRTDPESTPLRPRNDVAQYDDLHDEWWKPRGAFAMLHWIAAARATLVPRATRPGALLVDIGCGAGVLAPHVAHLGYRHLGVDVVAGSADLARERGVTVVLGDARALPLSDGCADVVVAGEVLEHVPDLDTVVAEVTRILMPGGTLVIDTIAATWWGRFTSITVGERIPAGPPARLHDAALFVDRSELVAACARHGVALSLNGLRPSVTDYVRWLLSRRNEVRMVPTPVTAGLFQAHGTKVAT